MDGWLDEKKEKESQNFGAPGWNKAAVYFEAFNFS